MSGLAILAALTMLQLAASEPGKPAVTKVAVMSAAQQCGTTVKFVDLPPDLRSVMAVPFAYNLNPSASKGQRDCFYKLMPTTKVGFISEPPGTSNASPPASALPTQQRLDALSDQCGTPHEWLKNMSGKRVWVRPSPDAKYEAVDCMLQKLKASNLDMDLGFIGNEALPAKAKRK